MIDFIQQFRNPLFDAFFKFLDFFDRQEFYFILIPAFWLGTSWKTGLRLFYILLISSLTNLVLKEFFLSPRPFHLDPLLGIIQVKGYGFPSGAAQNAMLFSGILLNSWKSRWKWLVAFCYLFFVSFSRVYLGIHFPTDIIGGWGVGLTLWIVYTYVRPPLEEQLEKLKAMPLFLLSQFLPLLLLFLKPIPLVVQLGGCAMGMGAGVFLNDSQDWFLVPSSTKKEFFLRALIGIIGIFFLYYLTLKLTLPTFFQFFLLGLWGATGALLLCRRLPRLLKVENA